MVTLKCKLCGGDMNLSDDQSVGECSNCGSRQTYNAPSAQEKVIVSDIDIINEIDFLLHLYKIALEGGIWSNHDGIFDDVQDVEYELAPEFKIPVVSEDDALCVAESDQQTEQPLASDASTSYNTKQVLSEAAAYIKQNKKLSIIAAGAACAMIVLLIFLSSAVITNSNYKNTDRLNASTHEAAVGNRTDETENVEALQSAILDQLYHDAIILMDAGSYDEAISTFEALDGHKDSADKISECHYMKAAELVKTGDTLHALCEFSKAGNYKDAPAQAVALRKIYQKSLQSQSISAGRNHTAALKSDGTVVTTGSNDYYQRDVSEWSGIVSIDVGDTHTVGLKADGTVVHAGAINYGQRSVSQWWDITAISAGRNHTIGLKADGTVTSAGRNDYGQCETWYWEDIAAISTGEYHTVGLKTDGTVVAVGYNNNGQCDVSDWTGIVAIYAGDNHTVGLKADGTAVAVGYNAYGQCDVSDWKDIIDIGIGLSYTVGLKADGTVVIAGYHYGELDKICAWTDIVDISVVASHIAGLKADGTVVTLNYDHDDQINMSGWTDIKHP